MLLVVCIVHALSPLLIAGVHQALGIDETVYLSQINSHVPAGLFSAPRARGSTLLAAPVTLLTTSVVAVRLYLSVLSGAALYVALRPWLRLMPGYVVPVAGLLFSSLWTTIFYGFEVMPNEWCAYGALAAVGYLLLALSTPKRSHVAAVALSLTWVALFRPSDGLYLALPMLIAIAVNRPSSRRWRLAVGAAVIGGVAAGWSEWVAEAYVSYGGFGARVSAAQAENGGGGVHFALAAQARALAGPILCRSGCVASAPYLDRVWWVAIPVLAAVGVVCAARRRALWTALLPVLAGLALAAEYIFTVTYAAPRFLTPAYALLALPCAEGALFVCRRFTWRNTGIRWVGVALAVAFLAHTAIQVDILRANVVPAVAGAEFPRVAHELRADGLRAPCIILGVDTRNQAFAYAARCANTPRDDPSVLKAARNGTDVVWLSVRKPTVATYWTSWRLVHLKVRPGDPRWRAYLSFPPAARSD